jgi:hypothetical protein
MAYSSWTGRRKKLNAAGRLIGVLAIGDMFAGSASLNPFLGAVDGTNDPTLEGGITSSVRNPSVIGKDSLLSVKTFLKRLFTGVAFTCTLDEAGPRGSFLTSAA